MGLCLLRLKIVDEPAHGRDLYLAHHLFVSVNITKKKKDEKHLKREPFPFLTFLYFAQSFFPAGHSESGFHQKHEECTATDVNEMLISEPRFGKSDDFQDFPILNRDIVKCLCRSIGNTA